MRQSETTFKDISKGLRRYKRNPRNTGGLVECFNLAPDKDELKPHDALLGLGDDTVEWDGKGVYSSSALTRSITIAVTNYDTAAVVVGITVSVDGVSKGVTDAGGELIIAGVAIGRRAIILSDLQNYYDSDDDSLCANDAIFVYDDSETFDLEAQPLPTDHADYLPAAALLIHSDEADGETTIEDSSENAIAIANTSCVHSTTYKKFGASSIYQNTAFDNLNLGVATDLDLTDEDFTIDFWAIPIGSTDEDVVISKYIWGGTHIYTFLLDTGTVHFGLWLADDSSVYVSHSGAISSTVPTHAEVTRKDDTLYLFVNGVLKDSDATLGTKAVKTGNVQVVIGNVHGFSSTGFVGYLDEIHVIVGNALHTADFTPRTSAYAL